MPGRPDTIVLASGNAGKLAEIVRILEDLDITVVPQSEFGVTDADETGTTFIENALIKARHAVDATGLPAIADDSGICVDALDGRPGVYSARYAGENATDEANNQKLLNNLRGIPTQKRTAHFCCVMALVTPQGSIQTAKAIWEGHILTEPRGENGFGYDPYFLIPEYHRTFGELSPAVKRRLSHRARALAQLAPALVRLLIDECASKSST